LKLNLSIKKKEKKFGTKMEKLPLLKVLILFSFGQLSQLNFLLESWTKIPCFHWPQNKKSRVNRRHPYELMM
jgi:hypothetical protein